MAYEVVLKKPGMYRVLLEECKEGVYVNVFATEDALGPYRDTLQDDLAMAQRACAEDYGIDETEWRLVVNERWH